MRSAIVLFGSLMALFFAAEMSQGEPQQAVWQASSSIVENLETPSLPSPHPAVEIWRP